MVLVQHLVGADSSFAVPTTLDHLSVLSYNVLLPNSVDGWWNYKMYLPPLTDDTIAISTWGYRTNLLRNRIEHVDADVVCLQEVSPLSFESDFAFMEELGYDGKEMFKKGRFRPASFWKKSRCELVAPPVHKDRTLLTAFRRTGGNHAEPTHEGSNNKQTGNVAGENWYVLNCHLQAGRQASRRLRQINEGVKSVMTLARKMKEKNPSADLRIIVCGDFNGGEECGAVRFLEDGYIDETFREDGEAVSSGRKTLPFDQPLRDAARACDRKPPPTLVVPELISTMVNGEAYENPELSDQVVLRLQSIFNSLATATTPDTDEPVMSVGDVERYLVAINGKVGRGSEFREAARQMGWVGSNVAPNDDDADEDAKQEITLPPNGLLSIEGFLQIYEKELKQGKFWGIAHDLSVLGEPLPYVGVFQSRFDRIYHSAVLQPLAIMDFQSSTACPNKDEPSDHLPVAASFSYKNTS